MPIGALTEYLDVAQVVLYAFWIFFFGLIYYLRQEDKREGYPMEPDPAVPSERYSRMEGFPPMPSSKVFRLADGSIRRAPREERDPQELKAKPSYVWAGAPLIPTGNPMLDGVGPAAYAQRPDEAEKTLHGEPRIVPMRLATGFHIERRDPDPRGMSVIGTDGLVAGQVVEVWVDRVEPQIRYLEVSVAGQHDSQNSTEAASGADHTVLLPIGFSRIDGYRRQVRVKSILASQFLDVPVVKNPEEVTQLEEERITAYYGGGYLYAYAARQEPLL